MPTFEELTKKIDDLEVSLKKLARTRSLTLALGFAIGFIIGGTFNNVSGAEPMSFGGIVLIGVIIFVVNYMLFKLRNKFSK